MPKLYSKETIDALEWPKTIDGEYAKKYLLPLIKKGISHFIDNIEAEIFVLKCDDIVLPIVVANENYEDAYVCSIFSFYISLALEQLRLVENPFFRKIVKGLLQVMGKLLKKGKINSVVYVNNWMFSVDLYPAGLTQEKLKKITSFLRERFPDHAICLRSLNTLTTAPLTDALKKEDFHLIACRQVYVTDTKREEIFQTRIIKSDLKLLRETEAVSVDGEELSSEERERVLKLYQMLYLDEHTRLHPQINSNFISQAFDHKLFTIKALRMNGQIEGAVCFFEREGVMMCPIIGFDKAHPQHSSLYRLLSTTLLLEARKRQLVLHQSAGASFYKKVRRAESDLEWIAVYTDHLPLKQRLPWLAIKTVMNTLGVPFMKKY
jgi:hypothetical protein